MIVPCRDCDCGFTDAVYPTVPLPDPLEPEVTVSQPAALLVAVHAQPAGAVTDVVPVAPDAAADALAGFNVNEQPAAA